MTVADPGIERRAGGAPIFAGIYTHHSWHYNKRKSVIIKIITSRYRTQYQSI